MRTSLFLMLVFTIISKANAQDMNMYEKKELVVGKDTLRYRIMYPLNFDKTKKYPLILFLHGSGERGNDNSAQLVHGGELFAKLENQKNFPAIVIFPQCPSNSFWANLKARNIGSPDPFVFNTFGEATKPMELTIKLIKNILKEKYVDKKKVYVGGLSMGGMGTFEILYRCPKTFAAAFPICGGGNPESVKKYAKRVNMWVFHGAKDDIVPPKYSEEMVEAVKKKGGNIKLTLYPNANHNSWDSAFAEPDLLPWLFSNIKK